MLKMLYAGCQGLTSGVAKGACQLLVLNQHSEMVEFPKERVVTCDIARMANNKELRSKTVDLLIQKETNDKEKQI